jgi:hypothetical protein
MKKIVWFVQLVLFTIVIFLSSNALAACAYDENGNCIKMVIIAGDDDEGTSGGGSPIGGGLIGCGGCGGGGGNGAAQDTAQKITDAIKKSKDLCKKASEDCGSWGSRMTAPQPAGSGFCTNISAALPLIGTSVCINTVNIEVNLNYCANVGCP